MTEGSLIGDRYRLESVIGAGGMGTVWRARDVLTDRVVAVKQVRFPDESAAAAFRPRPRPSLVGPGVVELLDVLADGDAVYFVSEYVAGSRSLAEILAEDGRLEPARVSEIALGVLQALDLAHARGLVHGDLRPSKVLIDHSGHVRVTGFGIGITAPPLLRAAQMRPGLIGNAAYLAPEVVSGEVGGAAADLWALGVLLFRAVEGELPFERSSVASTIVAIVRGQIGEFQHAPPVLRYVVRNLLNPDRNERLGSAESARILRSSTPPETEPPAPGPQQQPAAPPFTSPPEIRTAPPGYGAPSMGAAAPWAVPEQGAPSPAVAGRAAPSAPRVARLSADVELRRRTAPVSVVLLVALGSAVGVLLGVLLGQDLVVLAVFAALMAAAVVVTAVRWTFTSLDARRRSDEALVVRGRRSLARGRYAEAEVQLREAVRRSAHRSADLYADYAVALRGIGRLDEARAVLQRALRQDTGDRIRADLAVLDHELTHTGADELAGLLAERAPSVAERVDRRSNHAVALRDQGLLAEAEAEARQAVATAEGALRRGHPAAGRALANLGAIRFEQGVPDEAAELLARALRIARRALGRGHPEALTIQASLAAVKQRKGDLDGAAELLQDVVQRRAKALGEHHPATLNARTSLGFVAIERGAAGQAEQAFASVLKAGADTVEPDAVLVRAADGLSQARAIARGAEPGDDA
ncbi:serine/threonine-protein kinase [Actinomadura rupiterrae]|uniref:serine/threonine-protein kinase n=1 Tax=Actinomadura rupiterrae TaxID=559627 RepID=UPI0020A334C5|nr:tetratricopeptide repeat protein [Actinomadura rupiterrae]MCP2337464.1 serine/threonine protein kinase [Actinomadura rupiterrae]